MQGRYERDLAGCRECGVLQALQRALDALLVLTDLRALEVGLLVEDLLQQHKQRGVRTARVPAVTVTIATTATTATPTATGLHTTCDQVTVKRLETIE